MNIELHQVCFKIDKANAKAMIEGVTTDDGSLIRQSIWLDVKSKHFPMLVSTNKSPSRFNRLLSASGISLQPEDYEPRLKYVADLDSEYFVRNEMGLWDILCKNGLFNIWTPEAPYLRFAQAKVDSDKFRICLLRLYEIDREFVADDVIPVTNRIDHLKSTRKKVITIRPMISESDFGRLRNLLIHSVTPFLSKPITNYLAVAPEASTTTDINSSSVVPPSEWTSAEYKATVEAYLWMLEQENNGKAYNKSKINQALRDGTLAARSKPSVEFRMRNISAVLEELCLPWIKGYLPAGNVRGEGKEKIKSYLANAGGYDPNDYAPTADPEEFEQKVQNLRKTIKSNGIPEGQKNPEQTTTTSSCFARDPLVKAWVLET